MNSEFKEIPHFRNYEINKDGLIRKQRFDEMGYSKKPFMVKPSKDGRVVMTNNISRTTRSVNHLLKELWGNHEHRNSNQARTKD